MNYTSTSLWRTKYLAIRGTSISQRRFASSETPSPTASLPLVIYIYPDLCHAHYMIRDELWLTFIQRAFYKTFTRPIAKTLLTATFIYQLTYWGWVKLEKDELKAEKLREIKGLEAELEKVSGGAIKGEDVKVKGI